jgi:hypothetical protein
MEAKEIKSLLKSGNLSDIIRAQAKAAFGEILPDGMDDEIKSALRAVAGERTSNLDLGLEFSRLRARFKIDQHWMPVRKGLAKLKGRGHSYIDQLIDLAEKASKISDLLLAALLEEGIDPTEKKYETLVAHLAAIDFSGETDQAAEVVRAALDKFRDAKKAAAAQHKKDNEAAEASYVSRSNRSTTIAMKHDPSKETAESLRAGFERALRIHFPGATVLVDLKDHPLDDGTNPKSTRTSRPRRGKNSDATPHSEIPGLFDIDPNGDQAHRPDASPTLSNGAVATPAQESNTAAVYIGPGHPFQGGSVSQTYFTRSNNRNSETVFADKDPSTPLRTDAQLPSNFFADRYLDFACAAGGDQGSANAQFDQVQPHTYLVSGLFGDTAHTDMYMENLTAFGAPHQSMFVVQAPRLDSVAQIQSRLFTCNRRWPRNIVVSMLETGVHGLREKLQRFGSYQCERKCIMLLPFSSYEGPWTIAREAPDLAQILESLGRPWLVLGGSIDRRTGANSLSTPDASFLIQSAREAGCKIFYTSEAEMHALRDGDGDPARMLEAIHLDSITNSTAAGLFKHYRELPEFLKRPVNRPGTLMRSPIAALSNLGSQQLNA